MTRRRLEALALVAAGASDAQVAQRLGCSERTVRRYRAEPAFAAAIATAHDEALERARAMMRSATPAMMHVLISLASDPTQPAGVRRAAASDVLDRAGVAPPRAASAEDDYEDRLAPIFAGLTDSQRAWVPNEHREPDPESIN